MAEMPAAFEWEKAMGIDPLNLQEYEKDQLDEIISMFLLVIVHTSHHHHVIPAANLNFLCFYTVYKYLAAGAKSNKSSSNIHVCIPRVGKKQTHWHMP